MVDKRPPLSFEIAACFAVMLNSIPIIAQQSKGSSIFFPLTPHTLSRESENGYFKNNYMKIKSLFSILTSALAKDEVAQVPLQGKIMQPLSYTEIMVVAGGPEVENDPPPA